MTAEEALTKIGPYSGMTDGWGWRTNRHMLVAIRGAEQPENPPRSFSNPERPVNVDRFVRDLLTRPHGQRVALVTDLQAAAGPVCEKCDGALMLRCQKSHETLSVCEECEHADECEGDDFTYPCHSCRLYYGDPGRVVKIMGFLVDAQLLACVLRTCRADLVTVESVPETLRMDWRSLRLSAPDWRAAIMEGRFEESQAVEFTAWQEAE